MLEKGHIIFQMLRHFLLMFFLLSLSQGGSTNEDIQIKNEAGVESKNCQQKSTSGRLDKSCPALKALELTEHTPAQGFTYASLEKKDLPASFTICIAHMVKRWGINTRTSLFRLYRHRCQRRGACALWHILMMYAQERDTAFEIFINGKAFQITVDGKLYFPLQWIKVCLSPELEGATCCRWQISARAKHEHK